MKRVYYVDAVTPVLGGRLLAPVQYLFSTYDEAIEAQDILNRSGGHGDISIIDVDDNIPLNKIKINPLIKNPPQYQWDGQVGGLLQDPETFFSRYDTSRDDRYVAGPVIRDKNMRPKFGPERWIH